MPWPRSERANKLEVQSPGRKQRKLLNLECNRLLMGTRHPASTRLCQGGCWPLPGLLALTYSRLGA